MGKHTTQFKLSVIKAFLKRGYGYRHIGARFGVDPTLLRRWVEGYKLHGDLSFMDRARKPHSAEFKLSVLQKMWDEGLSPHTVAALFNLGVSAQVGRWQKQYYSGGVEALSPWPRGLSAVMPKPRFPKPKTPLPPESIKDEDLTPDQLLARLYQARVEIAYLKKLKALREEKARQAQAGKTKPG